MADTQFTHTWNLWYHHEKDNWSIDGYKKIYKIKNAEDFWKIYNNWEVIGGITCKQFFIMKNDVNPMWEDESNVNGGCWSFKLLEHQTEELWEELSLLLVTNELLVNEYKDDIIGLSICLKKNNFCVIKIWNSNSKNNSIKIINHNILKKWGTDIIYISHMPDKIEV
jgi:translation initiation factor 4E